MYTIYSDTISFVTELPGRLEDGAGRDKVYYL